MHWASTRSVFAARVTGCWGTITWCATGTVGTAAVAVAFEIRDCTFVVLGPRRREVGHGIDRGRVKALGWLLNASQPGTLAPITKAHFPESVEAALRTFPAALASAFVLFLSVLEVCVDSWAAAAAWQASRIHQRIDNDILSVMRMKILLLFHWTSCA